MRKINAVERALVAHDEPVVPIKEVGVLWGHERIVGEFDLAGAPHDVLVGLQVIREPIHAFAADQDQPRAARVLHVAVEVDRLVLHRVRDGRPTAAAELVPTGDGRHARLANVVLGQA